MPVAGELRADLFLGGTGRQTFGREWIGRHCGVGRLIGRFLLDNLIFTQVNFAVGFVADDVIPIGEAGVQLLHAILARFQFVVVLVLLDAILLFDPLPLGLADIGIFLGRFFA